MSRAWFLLLLAWLIATTATLGALFLGEVMGMTPCVLCWYQRIFMFPLALVLGLAAWLDDRRGAFYGLWLAAGGLLVASHHSLLVAGWVPRAWVPCGAGVSCANQRLDLFDGALQIPWLSLGAFAALFLLLLTYLRKTAR
jgi:disulfide bond formation protein DsbB